jgi:SAM-dependent methyltransferase
MHGHRKKALFFVDCLQSYSRQRGMTPAETKVLDIGCGNGMNVSVPIAERGFDVTGVDPHGPSIEVARSHTLPKARFLKESFSEHRSERLYDAVILSDVLEHVPRPELVLEVAQRLLAPGGALLISVPNGYGPFEVEQFLIRHGVLSPLLSLTRRLVSLGVVVKRVMRRGRFRPTPIGPPASNDACGHVQFFSLWKFERLLKSQGLVIEHRANGAWFGGDLTYFVFYFFPILVPITLRIADYLPSILVSSWYFHCRSSPPRHSQSETEYSPTS